MPSKPVKRKFKQRLSVLAHQGPGSRAELTLRHVQVFCLLWNTAGSFSEVAEKLGVTQPAISAALMSLEEMCGYELFHRRRGSQCQPTNAAITLYPYFDRALTSMQGLTREIENLRTNPDFGIPFRRVGD